MMLNHSLRLPIEAKAVEEAVRRSIDNGICTKDIGGSNSTIEVGEAIRTELKSILRALN